MWHLHCMCCTHTTQCSDGRPCVMCEGTSTRFSYPSHAVSTVSCLLLTYIKQHKYNPKKPRCLAQHSRNHAYIICACIQHESLGNRAHQHPPLSSPYWMRLGTDSIEALVTIKDSTGVIQHFKRGSWRVKVRSFGDHGIVL